MNDDTTNDRPQDPQITGSDYLWDGSGTPDEEIVRLETLLVRYRHQPALPPLPARTIGSRRLALHAAMQFAVAAASLVLVAAAGWFAFAARESGWTVQSLAGSPSVAGVRINVPSRLPIGEVVTTDAQSRARIDVSTIGFVDVEPNSRIRLIASRAGEHRMALDRGEIRARIWAPPRLFFVNTPSSTAIDLGCAYTLHVDDRGWGKILVESGWVAFEHNRRESFIPQNAVCATRPGAGPGTPFYNDAPEGFEEALTILDFSPTQDVSRAQALELVLSHARTKDAFTLWHLLSRGTRDERAKVYDRLASLVPPPREVTREGILSGDRRARDAWWNALGLDSASWWRIWKRKW
ncbi:MAG TPA: hypothetical protein VEL51_09225 [Vicinamibacterales bacterium]|nr:hypothetical protein [Vicinamibacterales bacterium]